MDNDLEKTKQQNAKSSAQAGNANSLNSNMTSSTDGNVLNEVKQQNAKSRAEDGKLGVLANFTGIKNLDDSSILDKIKQ